MNASTFSARVTASTLLTCRRRRGHSEDHSTVGGRSDRNVGDWFGENVRPYLEERLQRKAKIMGFGHRVYKVKDPRATIPDLAEKLFEVWPTSIMTLP